MIDPWGAPASQTGVPQGSIMRPLLFIYIYIL